MVVYHKYESLQIAMRYCMWANKTTTNGACCQRKSISVQDLFTQHSLMQLPFLLGYLDTVMVRGNTNTMESVIIHSLWCNSKSFSCYFCGTQKEVKLTGGCRKAHEDEDSVPTQSCNDDDTTNKQTGKCNTHTLKQRRPNREWKSLRTC